VIVEERYKYGKKEITVKHKCNGDCCRMFPLIGKKKYTYKNIKVIGKHTKSKELKTIANMVVPLSKDEVRKRFKKIFSFDFDKMRYKDKEKFSGDLFTCKHFNDEESKCMIYDTRPALCKAHPHTLTDGKCGYPNCGMEYEEKESGTQNAGKENERINEREP
jgi:Fe-S-cluster containining protein